MSHKDYNTIHDEKVNSTVELHVRILIRVLIIPLTIAVISTPDTYTYHTDYVPTAIDFDIIIYKYI